jgi:hypothetical protein
VQELPEAERGSHDDGHRELDVVDAEAACSVSCLDIATGTAHDSPVGGGDREAVAEQDVAQLGLSAVQAPGEPEAAREDFGGVVCVCAELVEKGAVGVERLFDRGMEQLFLAVEVVVERAHSHVGGLGEFEDGDVGSAGGEEGLGGAHEG